MSPPDFSPGIPASLFRDAHLRLAWAEFKVEDLEAAADKFGQEANITLERGHDPARPDTHDIVHVVGRDPIPDVIQLLFSDICQSAKSALDYLACALTRDNGAIPTRYTGFPIGNDLQNFQSLLSKIPDVSATTRQRIIDEQPYKGGNPFLYALHEINRTDKHIELVGAISSFATLTGRFSVSEEFIMHLGFLEGIGSLQEGVPIFSLPRHAEFEQNLQFTFAVCADNVEGVPRMTIGGLAEAICMEVKGAIERILA